jgi:hypothetical protein
LAKLDKIILKYIKKNWGKAHKNESGENEGQICGKINGKKYILLSKMVEFIFDYFL